MEHWTSSISHEILWFLFQDVFSYTANCINYTDHPILKSVLKVFYMLMVQYKYKEVEVICVWIQFNNLIKHVPCHIYKTVTKYIIIFSMHFFLSCWAFMY